MQCASCGAGLQITTDMDYFVCGYCGASLSVVRQGGTVALKLVTDSIAKVQAGTDRTAAELALVRLPKEIKERHRELDAMKKEIRYLKTEIDWRPIPPTGNSLIVPHALRAVVVGSAIGLFVGFFLDLLIPTSVAVYMGLFIAVAFALADFFGDIRLALLGVDGHGLGQALVRQEARIKELEDKARRQNAPHNAERLQELEQESSALKDRLQEINRQMAAARATVDS